MGYSRKNFHRPEFTSETVTWDTNKRGYCWKLCPWSTNYRDQFRYEGEIIVGYNGTTPVYQDGIWVVGNSTDESFKQPFSGYECSEHTTTSGRMEYYQNPPGWICRDPNCYYCNTVVSGEQYREI